MSDAVSLPCRHRDSIIRDVSKSALHGYFLNAQVWLVQWCYQSSIQTSFDSIRSEPNPRTRPEIEVHAAGTFGYDLKWRFLQLGLR